MRRSHAPCLPSPHIRRGVDSPPVRALPEDEKAGGHVRCRAGPGSAFRMKRALMSAAIPLQAALEAVALIFRLRKRVRYRAPTVVRRIRFPPSAFFLPPRWAAHVLRKIQSRNRSQFFVIRPRSIPSAEKGLLVSPVRALVMIIGRRQENHVHAPGRRDGACSAVWPRVSKVVPFNSACRARHAPAARDARESSYLRPGGAIRGS